MESETRKLLADPVSVWKQGQSQQAFQGFQLSGAAPSQSFGVQPTPSISTGFGTMMNPPSAFGIQNPPSAFGMQNSPSAFGMQNPPSAFGIQNPPSAFGMQNSPSAFASGSLSQPTGQTSVFAGTASSAFGSATPSSFLSTTPQQTNQEDLSKYSETDLNAFKSPVFQLGQIPEIPPPHSLRCI
jgi:hypothetical protein